MTVEIPLTRGFVAIVDADVADRIVGMGKWHAEVSPRYRTSYAAKKVRRDDGRRTTIHMHNVVTGWPFVDHINGNGLDNRRSNLRPATARQNNRNVRRRITNRSGFKGVSWDAQRGRWAVRISTGGRNLFLGRFADPVEAAHAYDEAAVRHFGEFARLNFPGAQS